MMVQNKLAHLYALRLWVILIIVKISFHSSLMMGQNKLEYLSAISFYVYFKISFLVYFKKKKENFLIAYDGAKIS